ncbi:MAG: polyisoprenoid-binding protein, partial [Burkholderiales bacterium PBB4]
MTSSKLILCLALAASAAGAYAQQKLVPTQSEIVFVSKQMGVPVEGRFKKFDAQISFDAAKLDTSKVN